MFGSCLINIINIDRCNLQILFMESSVGVKFSDVSIQIFCVRVNWINRETNNAPLSSCKQIIKMTWRKHLFISVLSCCFSFSRSPKVTLILFRICEEMQVDLLLNFSVYLTVSTNWYDELALAFYLLLHCLT